MTKRKEILVAALMVVLAVAQNAQGERVLVEKVLAVVEDEAILKSDVDQMVKQVLVQQGITNPTAVERVVLEKKALEELINNKLVVAKATRLGISISFSEVEKAVENALAENKKILGGEEAFERQLESEGLTLTDLKQLYREQIRNRMLVDRVLATEIDRSSILITEDDIIAAFEKRKAELPQRPAVVNLATIYISFESAESAQQVARTRIEDVYKRIRAGEDFAALATEYSEDPSAKIGGSLGTVKLADLSERNFVEAAAALSVGEVSEPVSTSYGFHIIKVTGKNEASGEVDLSHILIRAKPGEDDIETVFVHANKVHDRLVAGEDFAALAKEYSDDNATADAGGDLGWLRLSELPEFFQDVLADMKEGAISPVLREPSGFRIVKLLAKEEERIYEIDEVREELRKLVEQEKMNEAFTTYLAGLHDQFYVDKRTD